MVLATSARLASQRALGMDPPVSALQLRDNRPERRPLHLRGAFYLLLFLPSLMHEQILRLISGQVRDTLDKSWGNSGL